jgi:hypothetical protein
VIGRRALGFMEDMPENYEKLLKDRTYLEFALKRYEEREKELRELMEKESNEYKRNAIKSELRSVEDAKELLTHLSYKAFRTSQAPVREPMEGIPSRERLKRFLNPLGKF